MPPKKQQTLTLDEETRETDQLNVWCKVCGELVAEVKVIHADKPSGFRPVRRQRMLIKIHEQMETWRQEALNAPDVIVNAERAGNVRGAQFIMRTLQPLFRDFELEKYPHLLKG